MNTINVSAIERDGWNVRTLTIEFEILDNNVNESNIRAVVKKAVKEYLATASGKETLVQNGGVFNWADVDMSLPNAICEKYGFRKVNSVLSDIIVDWDDELN